MPDTKYFWILYGESQATEVAMTWSPPAENGARMKIERDSTMRDYKHRLAALVIAAMRETAAQHAERVEDEVRGHHRPGHVRRPRHAERDAHQGEGRTRRRRRRDREEGGGGARCVEDARAAGRLRVGGYGEALDTLATVHQPVRRRAACDRHEAVATTSSSTPCRT